MSAIDEQPEQPLCIHFVNTVSRHDGSGRNDRLATFEGFLDWIDQAKLLNKAEVRRWGRWGNARRGEANRVLSAAVRFREYLYALFTKSADAQRVQPARLDELNKMLAAPSVRRTLRLSGDRVVETSECGDGLMAPLRRVAVSAADVMTGGLWRKIILCDRDECDWLAIDTSRNHSRRYCSSAGCGNLARVTRHYRRHRSHELKASVATA